MIARHLSLGLARASLLSLLLTANPVWAEPIVRPCLCMMPMNVPFEESDSRSTGLEERVVRRLREAGFVVRRSREVEPIRARVDESRSFFDPLTGEFLKVRWKERQHEIGRALAEELGCDARIQVGVRPLMARNAGGSAVWDGQSVPIATAAYAFLHGEQISHVAATSLWIELLDISGESLSFRSAGIEPLINLSLGRSVDRLPEDRWLRDEAVIARAVESALGPMAIELRLNGRPDTPARAFPFTWPETR